MAKRGKEQEAQQMARIDAVSTLFSIGHSVKTDDK
jgi:hypothetical protein